MMGEKWTVVMNVTVEFNELVVVKVREGGWRIYQHVGCPHSHQLHICECHTC